MTISFPGPRVWNASGWMVRGFFDDARSHLAAAPAVAPLMSFGYDTEIYALNLKDAPREALAQMNELVQRVIADQPRPAADAAAASYLAKLGELASLAAVAASGGGDTGGASRPGLDTRPVPGKQRYTDLAPGHRQCYECGGDGACTMCEGTGRIDGNLDTYCHGTGRCIVCRGAGQIPSAPG